MQHTRILALKCNYFSLQNQFPWFPHLRSLRLFSFGLFLIFRVRGHYLLQMLLVLLQKRNEVREAKDAMARMRGTRSCEEEKRERADRK